MLAPIHIDRIYVNLWTYVNFTEFLKELKDFRVVDNSGGSRISPRRGRQLPGGGR